MRLAGEMVRRGLRISILAINDKFIDKLTEFTENFDLNCISCIRIPHNISIKEKLRITREFIENHNPEWISLQFVPFSFHDKGIPFGLKRLLIRINKKVQWHIMFHELWIRNHGESDLKMIIWSWLQKMIIRRIIFQLQPKLITTSIRKYQQLLDFKNTKLLPLFGNIPHFSNIDKVTRTDLINVVIYGSVTSCLDEFKEQILWLKRLSLHIDRRMLFVFIGNNGIYKTKATEIIENEFEGSLQISIGFVPKDIVSYHLSKAEFGISRADHTYFGKSGTTITMLEHGLPVLLRGKRPMLLDYEQSELVYHQLFYPQDPVPKKLEKFQKHNFIHSVTDQYLHFLHYASSK